MDEMTGTGLIHIYCGDGKGKTTTGMGLCVRAAGYGYRVLICQFMKNNASSERKILARTENITILPGQDDEKFSFLMTPEEIKERRAFYHSRLDEIASLVSNGGYDILFLDEAVYAVGAGLLDEDRLIGFLDRKPEKLEVILTGQNPSDRLLAKADYVSEIKKIRHPFDRGILARSGIEK